MDRTRALVLVTAMAATGMSCSSTMNRDNGSGTGGAGAIGGAGGGLGGGHGDAAADSSPDRTPGPQFACPGDNTCQSGVTYCHAFYGLSFDGGTPVRYLLSASCDPLPASCVANDCSCFPLHQEYASACLCTAGDDGGLTVGCSPF